MPTEPRQANITPEQVLELNRPLRQAIALINRELDSISLNSIHDSNIIQLQVARGHIANVCLRIEELLEEGLDKKT